MAVVCVCGGRTYADRDEMWRVLDGVLRTFAVAGLDVQVMHGGAPGADSLAEDWSCERGLPAPMVFVAEWDVYGRRAGPLRNARMVAANPDLCVAFKGNDGTADCVRQMRAAGIPVIEVR